MKKNIYLILFFIATVLTGCSKDYLNVVPDNVATIDNAFSNRFNTQKFLYTIYGAIPSPSNLNNPALVGGDEVWLPQAYWYYNSGSKIAQGFQSASDPTYNYWGDDGLYEAIRNCNIFLDRIDDVQGIQQYEKTAWTAEVKFLKAYFHYYLVRMYGPIVINDELIPVSASSDEIKSHRATIEECFTYIIDVMDESIVDLPILLQNRSEDLGRVTKPIAASIKARVLMTYASPLFNGNSVYSSFTNNDGVPYFPTTYAPEKWEQAATACKEAIDICNEAGIRLYQKEDYVNKSGVPINSDITKIKVGLRSRITDKWNFELIWGHTADTYTIEENSIARLNEVLGNAAKARLAPTIRIAETYYSENGVPIDEDISFDFNNRFKLKTATTADTYKIGLGQETAILNFDREPRFYADLGFDRGIWYGNGFYDENDPNYVKGRGGELASVRETTDYSVTGYWPKKLVAIPTTLAESGGFTATRYAFPIIRLADLYLYYAEALNEVKAAPDAEVYEYIDKVRERAGLETVVDSWSAYSSNPTKPFSKEGMREIIQQERMIELSFEGARFWDLRRWKLSKQYMSLPIKGWNVLETPVDDYYTVTTLYFPRFSEKDYLWPIPESETIKNPDLIQNPGW
ncbi:RagB/SusD family nutrient uptake outer membrane protein [Lutibacter sp. A80]|uniref:RagB/SusD family nutrient uptake outer membrane protein n=1 Tax=Lutibacter sp. A80 TaxID=2918453 RepID=UPI001F06393E|nr:RagB/SusD family nutrient uptake outer membrane protein [Lutibacter sp. A80]UMB60286.1 RagB/SusD family nutrient uptake outer membrane protein [Lutibacter sp. A80]